MPPEKFGIWEVEAQVGEGAFGVVYRCRDPFLKKHLAVKALKTHLIRPGEPELMADFFKEAELLAHFNHPAFTHIHYLNPDPPWIAMEFLEGETLEDLLRRKDQLGLDRIGRLFHAVCDGLHYIHAQVEEKYRTIHRDLKPANLLLTRAGGVKIIDFGVAKASIGAPTLVGVVKGTPLYMSPEHMAGVVDNRSDLWSLAVILFETLTGSKPYPDPDPGTAWSYAKLRRFEMAVLNDRFASLPETMPAHLREPLIPFFDQAFQVDKEKRYQDAAAFRAALDAVIERVARETDPGHVLVPPLSEVDALLLKAGDLFDQGEFGKARPLYEKALSRDPDNEEAHHWLLQIEDRLRESAESAAPAPAEPSPPRPAAPELPEEEVDLIGRALRRPALGLPEDLLARLRRLRQRLEEPGGENPETLPRELTDATRAVAVALHDRLGREAEETRRTLQELAPVDPGSARAGQEELDRRAGSAPPDSPARLAADLSALREVERHARDRLADVRCALRGEAAGLAAHLELVLTTHEGDAQSTPPALERGRQALAVLLAPSAEPAPVALLAALRAGAETVDLLDQEAEAAHRERQRERLDRSRAALGKALPESLAAELGISELRDRTLLLAREVRQDTDSSRLAKVAEGLEDLVETIHRSGPALRAPPVETPAVPPAASAGPLAEPPRVESPPARSPVEEQEIWSEPAEKLRIRRRRALMERDERRPPEGRGEGLTPLRMWWGLAAAGALVAGVVLVIAIRAGQPAREDVPPGPAPAPLGEGALVVDAVPWGHVREIVDLDHSREVPVPPDTATPARLALAPGRYRITVSHPDFGEVSVETDVRGGEVQTVGLQLPRFDVEKFLDGF